MRLFGSKTRDSRQIGHYGRDFTHALVILSRDVEFDVLGPPGAITAPKKVWKRISSFWT